jgi:hypothetical protein
MSFNYSLLLLNKLNDCAGLAAEVAGSLLVGKTHLRSVKRSVVRLIPRLTPWVIDCAPLELGITAN